MKFSKMWNLAVHFTLIAYMPQSGFVRKDLGACHIIKHSVLESENAILEEEGFEYNRNLA